MTIPKNVKTRILFFLESLIFIISLGVPETLADLLNSVPRWAKLITKANKIKIVEALWQIIYSNNEADIYETNLMRRLEGLMYIDSKIMGNIKAKIKKENL